MCAIEILELFVCVRDVLGRFPGVVFASETLPLDEVLELPSDLACSQNLFDLELFMAVDDVGRRRWRLLLVLGLGRDVWRKQRLVEDGVDGLPRLRQLQLIGRPADLLDDLERPVAPVV